MTTLTTEFNTKYCGEVTDRSADNIPISRYRPEDWIFPSGIKTDVDNAQERHIYLDEYDEQEDLNFCWVSNWKVTRARINMWWGVLIKDINRDCYFRSRI